MPAQAHPRSCKRARSCPLTHSPRPALPLPTPAGVVVAKPSNCQAYVVAAGDILFDVAAQFETTADQIIAINPALAAGGPLQPGTQILLPPA